MCSNAYIHPCRIGNIPFVWKVPDHSSEIFSRNLHIIEMAKEFVPVFYTQTGRKMLIAKYGRGSQTLKNSYP